MLRGNGDAGLPSGTIRAIIVRAAHFRVGTGQTIGGIKDSVRAGKLRSDNDAAERGYLIFEIAAPSRRMELVTLMLIERIKEEV